jgi:hypothetical protein
VAALLDAVAAKGGGQLGVRRLDDARLRATA